MFNQILEQVTGRFGLSQDKAKQLLGMLVAQIFNPKRGGPAGFLQSFRDQGLDDTVASWLGHGTNQPISAAQLEGVLGSETLNQMSAKLGVPAATVGGAAAAILPDAVNELSEHGDLPASAAGIPGKFGNWFGNLQDHLDELGHWSAAAAGAGAAALGASVGTVGDGPVRTADTTKPHASRTGAAAATSVREASSGGIGKWLPWLLLIAAAIAALFFFRSCQRNEAIAPLAPAAPVATPAPTAAVAAAAGAAGNLENAAAEAFAKLTPGQFSADDLVKALNLMIIHFDTDSANISASSDDILGKAAAAIKQAPGGTRIEVGGHTDDTGDAAANQRLSQQRADAVKARLAELGVKADLLASKGYGQDKPVADNDSAEGRAKNRRIEFTIQK
ncbi:OmpA family protein [Lysobacter koreensis]|uniref:OmpA family protein n=1 Tax=Lysobacter koreensis TaxID=266122 RepID=A0ABW2YI10_9GAMM